jgi:teichoic acid transport system permease protein
MTTVNAYSDVEYTFTPHSRSLPDVRAYVLSLWERRHFIEALAQATIRQKASNTTLGNLWRILNPLLQAGLYFFLYNVLRGSSANTKFLPVLIAGFFFFELTMTALTQGGSSIKQSKGLMLNSSFPRALLPLTVVYTSLRSFVAMLGVLVVLFPLLGGQVGPGFLVLPLLFAIQVVMNVGIALLMATVVTLVPDATNAMQYVARLMFFVTPVIYPVTLLPPVAMKILLIQPTFPVFAAYQAIFSGGTPSFFHIAISAVWAAVMLVVGGRAFLKREREFALYV